MFRGGPAGRPRPTIRHIIIVGAFTSQTLLWRAPPGIHVSPRRAVPSGPPAESEAVVFSVTGCAYLK